MRYRRTVYYHISYEIRYSMMASEVVINEVLCFLSNNFDKLPVSQLKPVIVSFYDDDELCNAKELLLKAVQRAIADVGSDPEMPRLPRRQGEHKRKQTVDDLLKLFTIADERNLKSALPCYSACILSRISFVNADSISVITMAKNIDALEQRMKSVEQVLLTAPSQPYHLGVIDTGLSISENSHNDCSPTSYGGDGEGICASAGDLVHHSSDTASDWKQVSYKRSKRNGGTSSAGANKTMVSKTEKSTGRQRVFGARPHGNSTTPKSGIEIVQKSVVHIDNLDPDCTQELLKDYLLSADIPVLTCFKAKSWLREEEKDSVTAFRVSVPSAKRHLVFDPQLWSRGTIIRDWQFKRNQNGRRT